MTTYQKFRKLKIDFAAIGLELTGTEEKYFCTPKGARIIASAGVDGIHYCFVRGQGEMVFAVSPMNETGRNVWPIARTFEDLLQLLMACGSMDAIEQAWQWDEEQFEEYIAQYPAKSEALTVFDVLQDKLGITPMENPYEYLCKLQRSYNYGELNFQKEYYDLLYAVPAERQPSEWKVTVDGGFCPERGKGGREIRINKQFTWGDEVWHVPAVYVCSKGLVVDFCIEANKEIHFTPAAAIDGETLSWKQGYGQRWTASVLCGEDCECDLEAKWVLNHYCLDLTKNWIIRRVTFLWDGRRTVGPESLKLKLERDPEKIPGIQFETPGTGEIVKFMHPITGDEHVLTVCEYETQEIDSVRFHDENIEFPTHLAAMVYTLNPDIPGSRFMLQDCDSGDRPCEKNAEARMSSMMFFGCNAVARTKKDGDEKLHSACSSLHFEPVQEPVQWQTYFYEKMVDDIEVELI